jgi:hypothetical protein
MDAQMGNLSPTRAPGLKEKNILQWKLVPKTNDILLSAQHAVGLKFCAEEVTSAALTTAMSSETRAAMMGQLSATRGEEEEGEADEFAQGEAEGEEEDEEERERPTRVTFRTVMVSTSVDLHIKKSLIEWKV